MNDLIVLDNVHAEYAGFWWRVLAYIVDALILFLADGLVGFIIGFIGTLRQIPVGEIRLTNSFVGFAFGVLYFPLFEISGWHGTPGKRVFRLVVTDIDGRPIGFGRAFGRNFGKIISFLILFIGYMMVGWTSRKQALHDKMAGCLVLRMRPKPRVDIKLPPSFER